MPSSQTPALLRYVGAASAYTVVHKLPSLWDGAVEGRNGRPQRMLAGEKVGALALSLALGPVLAPAWLLDDVNRLDGCKDTPAHVRPRGCKEVRSSHHFIVR